MTTPPTSALADVRNDRVLIDTETAILARQFPGVAVWFGATTRRWWALVRSAGHWRLVEANGPHDLSQLIVSTSAVSSPSRNRRPVVAPARPPASRRRSHGRHTRM